jgi:hypothetical protein
LYVALFIAGVLANQRGVEKRLADRKDAASATIRADVERMLGSTKPK